MARGQTLAVVRAALKRELRDAAETNSYQDALYNGLLVDLHSDMCNAYDWDFLENLWDVSVPSGTRYITIPSITIRNDNFPINFERPVHVDRFFNRFYYPVESGITMDLFNWRNSDNGAQQDPIMRWQMVGNTNDGPNGNQLEVWPIPLTTQVLRITGQRAPSAVVNDSDTFDLDHLLLVYGVAANELANRNSTLAQSMQSKFQLRLQKLRTGYENAETFVLGKNQTEEYRRTRLVSVKIGVA